MRIVLQRVKKAKVSVKGEVISSIEKGILILVGFCKDFNENLLKYNAKKIVQIRIFEDENGKMNRSVMDIGGELLVVSQFTLCANSKKGTRPSFDNALRAEFAEKYYKQFIDILKEYGINVKTGIFGEHMEVEFINDGPVTILL